MKLLQWNIWYKEKIENVLKILKEINADILCLQELADDSVFNKNINTAKYLKENLQMNMFYQDSNTWATYNKKSQGNAILTKYPIIKSDFKYLQEPNHDIRDASREGRIYLELTVLINNQELTIGTTHLSYTSRFEITDAKKKEVDNLVNILKTKKTDYIFTGDLNSLPDSYTIKEMSKYLKNTGPDFNAKTWTTKYHEDKWGFKTDKLDWRIDYVFCTEDVKIKSAKILHIPYSDHLPILVEFNLEP